MDIQFDSCLGMLFKNQYNGYNKKRQVSAAADRPLWRRGSAHAKYSVSHPMVIKSFHLLGLAAE